MIIRRQKKPKNMLLIVICLQIYKRKWSGNIEYEIFKDERETEYQPVYKPKGNKKKGELLIGGIRYKKSYTKTNKKSKKYIITKTYHLSEYKTQKRRDKGMKERGRHNTQQNIFHKKHIKKRDNRKNKETSFLLRS